MGEPLKLLPAAEWQKPKYADWRNARRTIEGQPKGGGEFMYANADCIAYRGECEHCHKPGPSTDWPRGWFYRFEWGYVCPDCAKLIEPVRIPK